MPVWLGPSRQKSVQMSPLILDTSSVTRGLDYFCNIWPFKTMKICIINCKNIFKFCPILKNLQKLPNTLKNSQNIPKIRQISLRTFKIVTKYIFLIFLPNWRNFGKFGHTSEVPKITKMSFGIFFSGKRPNKKKLQKLSHQLIYISTRVTRFAKISPLWQNFKRPWPISWMAYLVFGKLLYQL